MKFGHHTNTWGGVFGHPLGITSIKDQFYLTPGSMDQAVREIAAAGYRGFELFDGNLAAYETRRTDFRTLLRQTGIGLQAVYCGANFIYPDILSEELCRIQKTAALAAELGAEVLVCGGGALRAGGRQSGDLNRLADGLNKLEEITRAYGLIACYHPHHGTLVETPAQIDSLLQLTTIALCPDTGHILEAGGDPVEIIRRYRQRIGYLHLKDYRRGEFMLLGRGDVNVPAILSELHAITYDGWVTVELDRYGGSPGEAAESAMSYLKSLQQ
jgi:inosose dehydratase